MRSRKGERETPNRIMYREKGYTRYRIVTENNTLSSLLRKPTDFMGMDLEQETPTLPPSRRT